MVIEDCVSHILLEIAHPVVTDAIDFRNRDTLTEEMTCKSQKRVVFSTVKPYDTDTGTGRGRKSVITAVTGRPRYWSHLHRRYSITGCI